MKIRSFTIIIIIQVFTITMLHSQNRDTIPPNELENFCGTWKSVMADSTTTTWDIGLTVMDKGIYSIGRLTDKQGDLVYQADALWAFNRKTNTVTMYEINSADVTMIHVGRFITRNKIYVARYDKNDNKKLVQESILELTDNDNLAFTMKYYTGNNTYNTIYNFKRIR